MIGIHSFIIRLVNFKYFICFALPGGWRGASKSQMERWVSFSSDILSWNYFQIFARAELFYLAIQLVFPESYRSFSSISEIRYLHKLFQLSNLGFSVSHPNAYFARKSYFVWKEEKLTARQIFSFLKLKSCQKPPKMESDFKIFHFQFDKLSKINKNIKFSGGCYAHNDPLDISESLTTGVLS